MYQHRNVIHRLHMGESDRTIARTKLIGRGKCKQVRRIAEQNGWLGKEPLPDDGALAAAFEIKPQVNPPGVPVASLYGADTPMGRAGRSHDGNLQGPGRSVRLSRQLLVRSSFGASRAASAAAGELRSAL